MDPEQWERVKTVFEATLDLVSADRAAFLDQACGGDEAVRAEVESLLASQDESGQFLARRALDDAPLQHPARRAAAAGRLFGQYRIVREIGHGGMGAVFLAERADGAFDHQVAIKIIRHTLADAGLDRRFRRERQILASLTHPGIARLLDGGMTPDGEPYFVMEYIEGEALPIYLSRMQLDVARRLALFQQVCAAVSYAHRTLVVHGDLKPSNILVTGDQRAKLIDFGLARVLDLEGAGPDTPAHTVTAMRAFTPGYASPEQARGDRITTSSDVYSLGVILFELLSGERPYRFDGSSIDEIVQTLNSTPPLRPSLVVTRRRSPAGSDAGASDGGAAPAWFPSADLSGDLDNIVLMALRREPEQRYASVDAFAADVQRHQDRRPVHARAPTWSYRTSRFIGRNRIAVAASVLVAVSMLGSLATSLWQADLARDERNRANRRFDDVRQLSKSLLFELSPLIERVQGATEARDVLLRRAMDYLDSLARESADDVDLQTELAAGYEKVGDLQGNPGNPNLVELERAIESYAKARTIRERVLALRPEDLTARRSMANNLRVSGNIHAQANDYDRAGANLAEALRLYEALRSAQPDDHAVTLAVAQCHHDLGRNLSASKRYAGALPYFRTAIAMAGAMWASAPTDLDVARLIGDSHAQLGLALSWEGQQREAEAEMGRAAATYDPLLETYPNDVNLRNGLWSAYWLTSSVYEEQNDTMSDAFAAKALAVAQSISARDPANVRARHQVARSFSRLGQTATNVGRPGDAVGHLEQSCRLLREITAAESKNGRLRSELALAVTRLAEATWKQGRGEAALGQLDEAVSVYGQLRRAFPDDRRSARNLALTHQLAGEIHDAMAASGGHRASTRRAAHDSYQAALAILMSLRDQQALAEFDLKFLAKMQDAVARHP